MSAKTRVFALSVSKLPRRKRSKIAAMLKRLAQACMRWLTSGTTGTIGYRLAQVAIGCSLAAAVAGGVAAPVLAAPGDTVSGPLSSAQNNADIARDADGDYVVVWQSAYQDGNGRSIYARRYNAANEAQCAAFRVNDEEWMPSGPSEANAKVAMDVAGNFVIAWEGPGPSDSYGIVAKAYTAEGVPRGPAFQVNTYLSNYQISPDVAVDANGDFVVVWQSNGQESFSGGYGIYGRRFNAAATPVGGEFHVNSASSGNQNVPAVAMDYNGNFIVAWENSGSGSNIQMRRYDAAGVTQGPVVEVTSGNGHSPDVAMDADGDSVVTWVNNFTEVYSSYFYYSSYSFGYFPVAFFPASQILFQRFDATGAAQGGNSLGGPATGYPVINRSEEPSVAMDADGDFVIAFENDYAYYWSPYSTGSQREGIYVREFNASGSYMNEFTVASYSGSSSFSNAAVAMDADGDMAVVWDQYYAFYSREVLLDGNHALYYGNNGSAAPVVAGVYVPTDHHRITQGEVLNQQITRLLVTFSEDVDYDLVRDTANWALTNNGTPVTILGVNYQWIGATQRYGAILDLGDTPLEVGDYQLSLSDSVTDYDGNALDGDFDAVAGGFFDLGFTVGNPQKVGPEFVVNTTLTSDQISPDVAMDAAGNYVVVWQSDYQSSGSGWDIVAQRYNADGTLAGAEFTVNQTISGDQFNPSVAMDDAGNFVVVWQGRGDNQSGSSFTLDYDGIFMRRFDNAGVALADEQFANNEPGAFSYSQGNPDIAMDADGDFAVAWDGGSFYGDYNGVFVRRFNRAGNPISGVRGVNTQTSNYQGNPAIAMDDDGDFVVVYESYDFSSFPFSPRGVHAYVARFANDGNRLSNSRVYGSVEFFTEQYNPDVAMDGDGDFVVVYQLYYGSYSSPGFAVAGRGGPSSYSYSFTAIHAVRFDADTNALDEGETIRVDEPVLAYVNHPRAAMDLDGNFAVAWTQYADNYYSQADVMVRRYNWLGQAQTVPMDATSDTPSEQYAPAVAMDHDGAFVVAWEHFISSSSAPSNSAFGTLGRGPSGEYDVHAQRFDAFGAPTVIGGGIVNFAVDEDDAPTVIDLSTVFSTDDSGVIYNVSANSNTSLVNAYADSGGNLNLVYLANQNGTADITVRATSTGGQFVEDTFTVTVNAVNDAPMLDLTSSPTLVALYGAAPIHYEIGDVTRALITDVDTGALEGVAITSAEGDGLWQFSTDGGSTWTDFPSGLSETSALLLDDDNDIRFVPNVGSGGSATLHYRAWDQSDAGTPGTQVDVSVNGGISAFSSDEDVISVRIVDGNEVINIIKKKKKASCAADDSESAPWGLFALMALVAGGMLTRRRSAREE